MLLLLVLVVLALELLSVFPKLVSIQHVLQNYSQPVLILSLPKVVSMLPLEIWKKTTGNTICTTLSRVLIGLVIKTLFIT